MITTVPDYFDGFHCLAGSCPDTCCGQWEIVVDEAAEARYRSVSGDLGQRIRAALVTMDGETCMALEHGRCPLLTAEGLCPIVTELGEDFLSETCHTHPRFTEVYGGLRETMLSISCPEAAPLLVTRTEPLAFVAAREGDCSVVLQALRSGELPLRVTHNDTKLNNVLLDRTTGEAVCVIDLDTVMPGLSINDFGDSIRFGANHCAEDETDLDKVNFDLNLFDAYTRGFLEGAEGAFTPAELDYLPWGARVITLECGIRFLTDYLEGDHYFRIHRPGQNLDRCRTQFKLVADIGACWVKMGSVVDQYR